MADLSLNLFPMSDPTSSATPIALTNRIKSGQKLPPITKAAKPADINIS
jgi:hypothetical protein